MAITQAFKMAFKSLLARKLRSLLTMLGIIIGVAAVIVIMTIGQGTLAQVEARFDKMGANMISVSIYNRAASRQFSLTDMYELVSNNPELLQDLSPEVVVSGGVKYGNRQYGSTKIQGVSEAYTQCQLLDLQAGRWLGYMDMERRRSVCVVGSYVAEKIMGGGDVLGDTLKIRGRNYKVVGVLATTEEEPLTGNDGENSADNQVYIPYTNAVKLGDTPYVGAYSLNSASREASEAAVELLEARLMECYGDDDYFRVVSQRARLQAMLAMQSSMLSVLSAIAGIALLVGGVGIMNIMSVSVQERTKEIGVRKSFGARRRDIRLQFIIEAGSTSAAGGLIGVALGVLVSVIACWAMGLPLLLTAEPVFISFGVSVGIGVIFGYLPANRAARLEPIDALRYD